MTMKTDNSKLIGCSKSSSKRELYSNTNLPQETRKTPNKQPNLILTVREKEEQKLQSYHKDQSRNKKKAAIAKINKTNSWFLEKIKLTNHQPYSSRKKGRRLKSINLEVKKEKLQQTMQKYKGS